MQYSGPTPALPRRTSRHEIVTGVPSRNSRGARSMTSVKLPGGRFFKRNSSRVKRQRASDPTADRRADPGYYLIANGRVAFEQEIGFRMPIKTWLRRAYVTQATLRYLGTIAIVIAFILSVFLFNSGAAEVGVVGLLLVGLLALIPASDLAIALVNREVTEMLGPRALPRLALRDGVPEELRTLVVVPTLLIRPRPDCRAD